MARVTKPGRINAVHCTDVFDNRSYLWDFPHEIIRLHEKEVKFNIHHIVSFANKDLRTDPNNLVLLCFKCHKWVHSKANKNKSI